MTRINLSGLQSLDIPQGVFGEFFEKSQHYGRAMYPEGQAVFCDVVWEQDNPHQTQAEPALAVKLDNCIIGYIPTLSTIQRYCKEWERKGRQAKINNDLAAHEEASRKWKMQHGRFIAARDVRQYCERELFVEKRPCQVELGRVQVAEDTGKILSISVDTPED